jgi:hypothetical protein
MNLESQHSMDEVRAAQKEWTVARMGEKTNC